MGYCIPFESVKIPEELPGLLIGSFVLLFSESVALIPVIIGSFVT